MGRKKCCVCGGRNKKRSHKVCDMVELKSYLEVTNDSKYVCDGCSRKKYDKKETGTSCVLPTLIFSMPTLNYS